MTDTRNVIDYYKYWNNDAIKADLDTKRHNFSILISNKFNDFNIGTVIRNANAFMAKEVIIYGKRKYDKRGAVGTYNYTKFRHVKEVEELVFPSGTTIIGVDNIDNAHNIVSCDIPRNDVVFVLGQEDIGIPEELKAICQYFVYIQQFGSTRSLNVGVASGIIMYEYCRRHCV